VIENRVTFVTFLVGIGFSWKGINTNGKGRVLRGLLQFDRIYVCSDALTRSR
jgi:hypothetical protein